MGVDPVDSEACYCCTVANFTRTVTSRGWSRQGIGDLKKQGAEINLSVTFSFQILACFKSSCAQAMDKMLLD